MDEAERCTRVGLMYEGRLIADDTPLNIKKKVTGDLLEIAPTDFGAARNLMNSLEYILELQTYGDKLHVFVNDAAKQQADIESALLNNGIQHEPIRKIDVRMEEAFISLIRQQDARGKLVQDNL